MPDPVARTRAEAEALFRRMRTVRHGADLDDPFGKAGEHIALMCAYRAEAKTAFGLGIHHASRHDCWIIAVVT